MFSSLRQCLCLEVNSDLKVYVGGRTQTNSQYAETHPDSKLQYYRNRSQGSIDHVEEESYDTKVTETASCTRNCHPITKGRVGSFKRTISSPALRYRMSGVPTS
jgi:hypothetical protein